MLGTPPWHTMVHVTALLAYFTTARLAQSAERKALNLVVVGSSPTVGALSLCLRADCDHYDEVEPSC